MTTAVRDAGGLEGLRAILAETSHEELPQLIGALETTKAEAQIRLIGAARQPPPVEDRMLSVAEAAHDQKQRTGRTGASASPPSRPTNDG